MANPSIVFFALVLAIAWFYLGLSALVDGRRLQGVVGLGLAVLFTAWATITRRKRQDTSG